MTGYSAVYVIREKEHMEEYAVYAMERLKRYADHLAVVSGRGIYLKLEQEKKGLADRWFPIGGDIGNDVRAYLASVSDKTLFSDDMFFGPLFSVSPIIDKMEKEGSKLWSLTKKGERFFESGLCCVGKEYFEKLRYAPDTGFFLEGAAENDICLKSVELYDGDYEPEQYRSYDLIKSGDPYLSRKAFECQNFDLTMGAQIQYALEYIERSASYDAGLIYKNVLRIYNMTALYRQLHWTYVLPENGNAMHGEASAAMVASLYYEKSTEKNMEFLSAVPAYADVYVIVKNYLLLPWVEDYVNRNGLKWRIIQAKENRGRDLSTLLVEAADIFARYEYFCFLHDKQTTGNSGADLIGDDFNDMLFENLIGRGGCIDEIIRLFEMHERLGMLAPPEVCHGTYFPFLGREWSNNYENTAELAARLGLNVRIEREYPPYILATAFWCRTDALKKLFEYGWKYEDFPEEPLDMDGTLNHALERILMYVCQDAGYYAGIVCTGRFAGLYMTNLRSMLDGTLDVCYKNNYFTRYSELITDTGEELLDFCGMFRKRYIYGAGGNASRVADFLRRRGFDFLGYIVSDGHKKKDSLDGNRIYELSEAVECEADADSFGIIVSVSEKWRKDVIANMEQEGIKNYLCV